MPARTRPPAAARTAAVLALAGSVALVVVAITFVAQHPLEVLGAVVLLLAAVALAWTAATRHRLRALIAALAVVALAGAGVIVVVAGRGLLFIVAMVALAGLISIAGGAALRWDVANAVASRWSPAAPARHGVLLMNPKSGGGKVQRFDLPSEAARRGIEPIVLDPGDDLRVLAEAAVERGADVLGMAGGDGSQAIVAAVAAEHDVDYVCVPAGTRNHLALDLGVDRNDVVGALDAFGAALYTRMDIATVDGRVFVNNVSLGVYAEIVASEDYRDNKLRTAAAALPNLLGPAASPSGLRLRPPDGADIEDPQIVIVSNNPYRLERLAGFGTRPHLDRGVLGVAALRLNNAADVAHFIAAEAAGRVDRFAGWVSWQAPSLDITAPGEVAAGVDGESCTERPPVRFEIRPRCLRARVAPQHPGMSPAARRPGLGRSTFLGLARVAAGRHSGLVQ
jgi:diacylglycerol kinase family enzyme